MSKKWQIHTHLVKSGSSITANTIIEHILKDRGVLSAKEREDFLNPQAPDMLTPSDVGIDAKALGAAIKQIRRAIKDKASIVVYADYDADGITAGAILWETLWKLGARVMPYIPHRVDEGYGLSEKGIDAVREQYDPALIITVDHGITARAQVEYAKKLGVEVIITDHHVKPEALPDCLIVHTTKLSGSGVSWFVSKELVSSVSIPGVEAEENASTINPAPGVELPAIGTIADLLPLVGLNRSIVKYGLIAMRKTKRIGLDALIRESGIEKATLDTYAVSHMLAPRLNAMGRLEHALDALRLLCTKDVDKAALLAQKLGLTNKERQKLTEETVTHARDGFIKSMGDTASVGKLIFLFHESYNPGIIGLVAGRLTEEYYRPTIVLAINDGFAKASARSIPGFNIVEAIRSCSDLLVDVGGHPMAAGFTIETKNIPKLQKKLTRLAEKELDDEKLIRVLKIDAEISLDMVTPELWKTLQQLSPFGFGNYEPVFASRGVMISDIRIIGATKKHLKLKIKAPGPTESIDAVAFNMAGEYGKVQPNTIVDIAYTIDMNEWNGRRNLQLKVKDIVIPR